MGRRSFASNAPLTITRTIEKIETIARTTEIQTATVTRTTHQDHYITIRPPPDFFTVTSYERTLTIPPSRETIYSPFPKSFEDMVYDNNTSLHIIQTTMNIFFASMLITFALWAWMTFHRRGRTQKALKAL